MSATRLMALVTLCAGLVGCAQVPPQSAELSATMGRDLQELQRSHRKAVDLLHDRHIDRVNDYINQVAVPMYVKTVVDRLSSQLSQDLAKATGPNATQADKDRIYDEMRKIALGVSARSEKQRQELIAPIEEARKSRLQEIDMAYAQMQQANSLLTAHLASIMKVHYVQDDMFSKVGLKDFRQKAGESALAVDKQVDEALVNAKDIEDAIARMKTIFAKVSNSNP